MVHPSSTHNVATGLPQSEEHKAAGGYDKLYIDCIPAVDPEANWDDSKVAELPEVLQKPLLKTADGGVEGLRSGGRSAIVFVGRQGYRLKGCAAATCTCVCCPPAPSVSRQ